MQPRLRRRRHTHLRLRHRRRYTHRHPRRLNSLMHHLPQRHRSRTYRRQRRPQKRMLLYHPQLRERFMLHRRLRPKSLTPHLRSIRQLSHHTHFQFITLIRLHPSMPLSNRTLRLPIQPMSYHTSRLLSSLKHPIQSTPTKSQISNLRMKRTVLVNRSSDAEMCQSPATAWLRLPTHGDVAL